MKAKALRKLFPLPPNRPPKLSVWAQKLKDETAFKQYARVTVERLKRTGHWEEKLAQLRHKVMK